MRWLMRAEVISEGTVDEQSIATIDPAHLAGFTQCHFFAGIGIWQYSLRLAAWPEEEEVWTGSCPCQPFSPVGKRKGKADERHLWPAWFRQIRERRPGVVFGEQVADGDGIDWLDHVQNDMESIGYRFGACVLPAAGFGAPHGRHRTFFVADTRSGRLRSITGTCGEKSGSESDGPNLGGCHGARALANAQCERTGQRPATEPRSDRQDDGVPGEDGALGSVGNSDERRREALRRGLGKNETSGKVEGAQHSDRPSKIGSVGDASSGGRRKRRDASRARGGGHVDSAEQSGSLADSQGERLGSGRPSETSGPSGTIGQPERLREAGIMGNADGAGSQTFQRETIQRTGRREEGRATMQPGPTSGFWRDAVWIECIDGKKRAIEPGSFPLAYGSTARVLKLCGYGDAIVPQVAAAFIETYLEIR